MSKIKFCVLAAVSAAVSPFVCAAGEIVDGVYKITVAEDETRDMTDAEASELIAAYNAGTVTEFRKCGKGTLASASLANYKGRIVIAEGVYLARSGAASFGTSDGETVILDGASMYIGGYMELWYEHFRLSGNGFNGTGVILADGQRGYFSYLTLDADCLLVARNKDGNSGFFNINQAGNKPFNMNGHTLTIDSANQNITFHGGKIINPGSIVNLKKRLTVMDTSLLTHGPSASLTLGGTDASSDITIPAVAAKNNWTINYANPNSTYGIVFAPGASWYGPIVLDVGTGTAKLDDGGERSGAKVSLYGNLSGEGNFSFGNREVYFYGTNTITGELRGSGFVTLANAKSVGDYSKFKITNPVWCCHSEGEAPAPGFTAEEINRLLGSSWGEKDNFYVHVPNGCVFDYPYDISSRWTRNFYNRGEGVFQFSGTVGDAARFAGLDAGGGTIRFTGRNDNAFSYTYFLGGRFELADFSVTCTNKSGFFSTFSADAAERPTTVVITNSFVSIPDGGVRTFMNEYNLSALMRSVVEILSDSVVTNNIVVGYVAPNSTASVYMRGGLVNLPSGAASLIGRAGQGYWELTGGDMSVSSQMHMGYLAGSVGMHYISGGSCTVEDGGGFQIGGAGTAVFYQSAGRFRSEGFVHICGSYDPDSELDRDACGVMTVTGDGTECSIADYLLLARRSDSSAAVNINGGAVLETPRIVRAAFAKTGFYSNDCAYVNFNGGVLHVSDSKEVFGSAEEAGDSTYGKRHNHPTAVTVFEGGAIIDSSDFTADVSVPLLAPVGKGVVSVPMPESADTAGYIAPPVVKITGDGTGATAAAVFDSKRRTWTGIAVTSPGWGYTAAKAVISWGGKKNIYEVDCVLGDVSGGGLEKRGSGELRLKRANTYTGATVVSGGSLVLADEGSIAASGSLTVGAGAELSVENGAALDFAVVAGCGTVKGDLVISGTLKVKASDLLERRCLRVQGTVTFGPSASIVVEPDAELPEESRSLIRASGGVVNAPAAVSGVGGKWFFSVQGGTCRLVCPRSVGIIVR